MAHNHNFNDNFRGSNFTFRFTPPFPPPPLPPPILPFFPPPTVYPEQIISNAQLVEKNDKEFIKMLEKKIPTEPKKCKVKATTITQIREEIQSLVIILKEFEHKLNCLKVNIDKLPEEEWKKSMDEINDRKKKITDKLEKFVSSYVEVSRKLLAKRTAKRLRLKRLKEERKSTKKERMKLLQERSRKIDENLQKIKDDILKAQKADEAKLEADVVLREVRRKKLDAKKYLVKLDALLKLRKARQNTSKGRGETVSEKETTSFANNIEKLKSLWKLKLLEYEKDEVELQAKLVENSAGTSEALDSSQMGVESNLAKWREFLFGDCETDPQVDFQGDIHRFIAVRSQWDMFINNDGSPLPVGWVVPPFDP